MTDATQASGAGNLPGGAGGLEQSTGQTTPASTSEEKHVAWDDHQRALRDLHRFKDQTKTQAQQVTDLQTQIDTLNGKLATQNKDFESLWGQEKTKREAIETEKKRLLENVLHNERHRAAYPALKKAGLRDDAENLLDHLDFTGLDIEATSSGRFVVSGVDSFTELTKSKYPYAFQKAQPPVVNGTSGNGMVTGETWSPARLVQLEMDCKKKGDMAPYKAAYVEYLKQRKPG